MVYFSGLNGILEIDGKKAGRVTQWSLSSTQDLSNVTCLGDTDTVSIATLRGASGSCSLFYYQEVDGSNSENDASNLINRLLKARLDADDPGVALQSDTVVFRLVVKDKTATGNYVKVEAYITNVQMRAAVGDVVSAEVTFQVVGAPLEVNL